MIITGSPEQYRYEQQGAEKTAEALEASHALLESLRGRLVPVTIYNLATYQILIAMLEQEIESSFSLVFRPATSSFMQMIKSCYFPDRGERELSINLDKPLFPSIERFHSIGSRKYSPPLDQSRAITTSREILGHFHSKGVPSFSEADHDIIARSADLIHGVASSKDLKTFSMTTYDPATKIITPDMFRFNFMVSRTPGTVMFDIKQ